MSLSKLNYFLTFVQLQETTFTFFGQVCFFFLIAVTCQTGFDMACFYL